MGEKANSLPRSFYVISVVSFLFSLTRNVTQPIFSLYVLELGASLRQVGFILSIQSFLMIVARIPLTLLAEKIGRYKMFAVTFVIQATTSVLYAIAPSSTWLYLIPFYQIIASGSFNQLAMSTASDMAPATRQGDALGRYMTFMTMGMFVGPLITGVFITQISYRQLYLVTALFPIIGLVLFLRNIPRNTKWTQSEDDSRDKVQLGTLNALRMILRNRNVLILTLIRTTYSMSNTVFTALFAVYAVRELGFSPSLAALLFSVVGFANAFVKFPAGTLSDRLGAKRVLFASFGVLILVYASIPYAKTITLLLPLLVLFGLCWGTRAVTEWATLANTVTQETKALAMSYLSSVWGLGATLGSLMLGIFGDTIPFSTIFLILGLINIPALPAIYLMKNTRART
ncbi:MAG: MFS transporter [Candidatus Bathyarchaeota archaeon]|nr:MFS transporter [Candidatus Bathyarchaeota archaeon]